MKFKLEIDCDTAAFKENRDEEIARILLVASRRIEYGGIGTSLFDANANKVGTFQLEEDWSGTPDPTDPDNFWIDDATGERKPAP